MKEQRTAPRIEEVDVLCITVVDCSEVAALEGKTFFSLTKNISAGGLSFSTHVTPAVGTKMKITVAFSSPLRAIGNLIGRVVWVGRIPHGTRNIVGIDLTESPKSIFSKWKEIVSSKVVAD